MQAGLRFVFAILFVFVPPVFSHMFAAVVVVVVLAVVGGSQWFFVAKDSVCETWISQFPNFPTTSRPSPLSY